MKKLIIMAITILSFSGFALSADLTEICRNGVKTEIFTAKAAMYKNNGSLSEYKESDNEAKFYGAKLGYPDFGIDMMVNAGVSAIERGDEVTVGLSTLDPSDFMISSLIEDCLKRPKNWIRNYSG